MANVTFKDGDKQKTIILKNQLAMTSFILISVPIWIAFAFLALIIFLSIVSLKPLWGAIIFTLLLSLIYIPIYFWLYNTKILISQDKKTKNISLQRIFFIKNSSVIFKKSEKPYIEIQKAYGLFDWRRPYLKTKKESQLLAQSNIIMSHGWMYSEQQLNSIGKYLGIPVIIK